MPAHEPANGRRVEYTRQGDDLLIQIDGKDYGLVEQTKAADYLAEAAKRGQDELVAAIQKEPWVRRFGGSASSAEPE